jgi:hypothetical protein
MTLNRGGGSLPATIRETWAAEIEQGTMRSLIIAAVWPTDQSKPTEEQLQQASADFLADNDPLAPAALLRAGGI